MRHRLEDIGRIMIMLENCVDLEVFQLGEGIRKKDFVEWFSTKSEDERDDILHKMIYGMEEIKDRLYDILTICKGEDLLNYHPDPVVE